MWTINNQQLGIRFTDEEKEIFNAFALRFQENSEENINSAKDFLLLLMKSFDNAQKRLITLDNAKNNTESNLLALEKQLENKESELLALQKQLKDGNSNLLALEKQLENNTAELENKTIIDLSENQKKVLAHILANRKNEAKNKGVELSEDFGILLVKRFFVWDVLQNWSGEFYTGLTK